MKNKTLAGLLILFLLAMPESGLYAQAKAYKDGTVWSITMVKTKTGMGDDYLKSLKATLKVMYDEAIKQGLMISYKVLEGDVANPGDWDMLLMVEYKNLAAMEGHDDQWDAIRNKVLGGDEGTKTLMKNRVEVREIFGSKTMREVIFN